MFQRVELICATFARLRNPGTSAARVPMIAISASSIGVKHGPWDISDGAAPCPGPQRDPRCARWDPHCCTHRIHVCYIWLYMVTFTINIPQMLAYIIPYMDPYGVAHGVPWQLRLFGKQSLRGKDRPSRPLHPGDPTWWCDAWPLQS